MWAHNLGRDSWGKGKYGGKHGGKIQPNTVAIRVGEKGNKSGEGQREGQGEDGKGSKCGGNNGKENSLEEQLHAETWADADGAEEHHCEEQGEQAGGGFDMDELEMQVEAMVIDVRASEGDFCEIAMSPRSSGTRAVPTRGEPSRICLTLAVLECVARKQS